MRCLNRLTPGLVAFVFGFTGAAAGFCAAAATQQPQDREGGAIDLALARRAFAEAAALSAADGGSLWGVPLDGPMVFADVATRQAVANAPDPEGAFGQRGEGAWAGVLPDAYNIANTAFAWRAAPGAGRDAPPSQKWTMVMWPLPEDRYVRGRLLMHELFHRIQDDLGLAASDGGGPCEHLDSRDGRIWMRMEWRALREALIREGDQRAAAIEDALIFRAHRRALFPAFIEAERLLELNEGLAEYTGFKLCGLPGRVLDDRAAVHLAQHDQQATFARSFAYASGPAYGLLLDGLGASWRRDLSMQSDLGALLASAAKIALPPANDLEREASHRAERYDDGRVIAAETRREAQRRERQARFRARFIEGPVLTLPASGEVAYSFDPNAVEALPGAGTVFLTTRVTDSWGVLSVTSGGTLMERLPESGRVGRFRVPAPPTADPAARTIRGDGWTLELAEGWRLTAGEREGDWLITHD